MRTPFAARTGSHAHTLAARVGASGSYVFVGVRGGHKPTPNGRVSVVDSAPRVAGKPFLVEENGEWTIMVPPRVEETIGPLEVGDARIVMEAVCVARPGDDAKRINACIVNQRALLLTPGLYALDAPIVIGEESFVVLGIGFPTLVATAGRAALLVEAGLVRVSGVLLEAGTSVDAAPTEPLLRWAGSGGVASDVFSRVGAFSYAMDNKPSCQRTRAESARRAPNRPRASPASSSGAPSALGRRSVHVAIEGDDVTLDNMWLWHADHDDCHGLSDASYSRHGLVVSGYHTIALGLQV